jgi:hypothetical protein
MKKKCLRKRRKQEKERDDEKLVTIEGEENKRKNS